MPIIITLLSDLMASIKIKDTQSPLISELKHSLYKVLVERICHSSRRRDKNELVIYHIHLTNMNSTL